MIVSWLVACAPYTISLPADPVPAEIHPPAHAELSTDHLVFDGLLTADGVFAQDQILTVSNTGGQSLQLLGYAVEDPTGTFTVTGPGQTLLQPGDATTLLVSFHPTDTSMRESRVRIATNDPAGMELSAVITGRAAGPSLSVDTSGCALENTPTGCSNTCLVDMANHGNASLRIDDLRLEGSAILVSPPVTPWYLEPGEHLPLQVLYAPLSADTAENRLSFDTNDPVVPQWSVVVAADSPGIVQSQEAHPVVGGDVDILMVAKGDESMRDHLRDLVAGMPVLLDELDHAHADWRLMVVLEDDGCVVGSLPYLDSSVAPADRPAALHDMVMLAHPGGFTSAGFTLAERALSGKNVDPGGCNASFRRSSVPLAVIGLTDTAETSFGRWNDHVNVLGQLADAALQIDAFAGTVPASCSEIDPGLGWFEASNATHGTLVSLCEPVATGFLTLAGTVVSDRTTLPLDGLPEPASLEVEVDGRAVGRGWRYDHQNNAVVFEQADAPLFGSVVTVKYDALPVCE